MILFNILLSLIPAISIETLINCTEDISEDYVKWDIAAPILLLRVRYFKVKFLN